MEDKGQPLGTYYRYVVNNFSNFLKIVVNYLGEFFLAATYSEKDKH